jgi:hypothetical protein
MKIYYELYSGYNKKYDFMYSDDMVLEFSFVEPEEPKLLREIGVSEITERGRFIFSAKALSLMEQLLPEQIRVLLSHAYRIYGYHWCSSKSKFIYKLRHEVEQIAKQEIEPGMFKDEDIL